MRSLAVLNQKGGVGKTTSAVNLSAALAEAGHRVGIVDVDPQAHASLHLGLENEQGETHANMYDVLAGEVGLDEVFREVRPQLTVAAAHIDLAAVEVELADTPGRESRLRDALHRSQVVNQLDYLIVDCPPSLGILSLNALCAVEHVLLPLQPHFLALDGLSKLLETIQRVRQHLNPRLQLAGVVLCLYETATRLAAEVRRDVDRFLSEDQGPEAAWSSARLFSSYIRRNIRLAEAPSFGQSILEYAPGSNGAADYRALSREVVDYFSAAAPESPRSAA